MGGSIKIQQRTKDFLILYQDAKANDLFRTDVELSEFIGVSPQGITEIKKERQNITPTAFSKFKRFLDKKNNNTENTDIDFSSTTSTTTTGYYYPNVNAAAGLNKDIFNSEIEKIPITIPNWGKDLIFINVFGDSMYPKYCSGEIIGIKEIDKQYLNFGFAYVVVFNDGEVYMKYIRKGKDDKHWLLTSENEFYEPKEFLISAIKTVFIVKGVISKLTM